MTAAEIERIYLTARNAINELSTIGRESKADDMMDLEHKLWALSMYADEGRIQTSKHLKSEAA